MSENPYKSPEAESKVEAKPARHHRWLASRWMKASLLAIFSYALTSLLSVGLIYNPPQAKVFSLGFIVAAGLGVAAPTLTLPGIAALRGCGFAMHVVGWMLVLSIWRRRGAIQDQQPQQ